MSEYTLSVVLLIRAEHVAEINTLAESMGWGPDSLSVQLTDEAGQSWVGAHTMATPEFLELMDAQEPTEALTALVVSAVEGGEPYAHWTEALEVNGLARA